MAAVTYFVVVTFDRTEDGELLPGEPYQAQSAEAAKRRVARMSPYHTGAIAFSRTGDPGTGEFEDAVVLSQAGEVNLDAMAR